MARTQKPQHLRDYDVDSEELKPSHRHALLHVPSEYDGQSPVPLIIGLHGKDQPPAEFDEHTQFSKSTFDGLVVYPEGIDVSNMLHGEPRSP